MPYTTPTELRCASVNSARSLTQGSPGHEGLEVLRLKLAPAGSCRTRESPYTCNLRPPVAAGRAAARWRGRGLAAATWMQMTSPHGSLHEQESREGLHLPVAEKCW